MCCHDSLQAPGAKPFAAAVKFLTPMMKPMPLADADLAAVSGAKKGYGPKFVHSPVTITQSNVGGPIGQVAALNEGCVDQSAGFSQSNSVSF